MDSYITFREADKDGVQRYYILQRAFPHFIAEIVDNPHYKSLLKVPVPHTTMFLSFAGTIRGNVIPSYNNISDEIVAAIQSMALWYYENRILPNQKRYKKWLLKAEQTT